MENTLSGDISSNEVVVYSIVYMVYIIERLQERGQEGRRMTAGVAS